MIKKKYISVVLCLILSMSCLTGCGILKSSKTSKNQVVATNDSNKLIAGNYYIWHDENQTNIENDINTDTKKFKDYNYKIFTPVYSDSVVSGEQSVGDSKRIFWMLAENDNKIPTLYKGDALIYYSDTEIPSAYSFERFYDLGYSIGIYGLDEIVKGSGNYSLNSEDKIGVKAGSSCEFLTKTLKQSDTVVSLDTIGGQKILPENVSTSGTIKGLLAGSQYDATFYLGTTRYLKKVTCDTRIFSSMEEKVFNSYSYEFIGNGVIKVNIPDYFKSGYYIINGIGMFRYVADENFDSSKDDNSTYFNDPIIVKDDDGKTIYDPTEGIKATSSKTNNTDIINASGSATVVKKSINLTSNENVTINLKYSGTVDATQDKYIQIRYYMSSASSTLGDGQPGTKSNPYVINASEVELKNGELTRTIPQLQKGSWIFDTYGLDNFKSHSVTLTSATGNSSNESTENVTTSTNSSNNTTATTAASNSSNNSTETRKPTTASKN